VQNQDENNSQVSRNLLAALCVVLPVLFYFGDFYLSLRQVGWQTQPVPQFSFSKDGYCVSGVAAPAHLAEIHTDPVDPVFKFEMANLAGRLDFVLPSVLLRAVALISIASSFYIVRRSMRLSWTRLVVAMAVIVAAGFFVGQAMDSGQGTRALLMLPILSAEPAPLADVTVIDWAIRINLYAGGVAILVILSGLAAVTAGSGEGSTGGERNEAHELRERMSFLKVLIGFEVVIFVLLIVITKTATDWVTGLLCKPEQDTIDQISTALRYYWGVSATGVIVSGLLPAYYSWRSDVLTYANTLESSKSFKEAKLQIDDEGLTFTPTESILSLITVALPALTTPLLETAKTFLH
jgi:hypothetical protein